MPTLANRGYVARGFHVWRAPTALPLDKLTLCATVYPQVSHTCLTGATHTYVQNEDDLPDEGAARSNHRGKRGRKKSYTTVAAANAPNCKTLCGSLYEN